MDLSHFYDSQRKLHESEIKILEDTYKIKLHLDHKNLLLICNGGQTDKCLSHFENNGIIEKCVLNWILSISDDEYDNLETYIKNFKVNQKRLPDNLIPVCNDPGGNLFCISTYGDDEGKIYFWEHEFEVEDGEEPNYSNVFFVANSLEDFIDNLADPD
jgi:SMI1 / KNR4 family (SUKH-1)